MKIINIDSCPCRRWKDDLDGEPAICQRRPFSKPGSVEKGTTRTDTMFLERQRGDYHSSSVLPVAQM